MQEMQETWVPFLGLEDAWRRAWQPTPVLMSEKSHEAWLATVQSVERSWTRLSTSYTFCGWKMMYFRKGKKQKKSPKLLSGFLSSLAITLQYISFSPMLLSILCLNPIVADCFFSPNLFLSPCSFYEESEAGNCGNGSCHWLLKEDESSREIFQGPSPL